MPSPLETPALSVSEIPVLPALLITVNGVPDCEQRDSRKLPAIEKLIRSASSNSCLRCACVVFRFPLLDQVDEVAREILERQVINIADRRQMTFVEIRTGLVLAQIIRIHQNRIASIRSVVDRMAVGVRNAKRKRPAGVPHRGLQRVITRIGHILQRQNSSQPRVRPPRQDELTFGIFGFVHAACKYT